MASILVIGDSGSGKTTSLCPNQALGIKGLNPAETFIFMTVNKLLPFKGSIKFYKEYNYDDKLSLEENKTKNKDANKFVTNDVKKIEKYVEAIVSNRKDIKNIVIDDVNYIMQDYYLNNAQKSNGYNIFREIGAIMNVLFNIIEKYKNVNFIFLGHWEAVISNYEKTRYKLKTVGNMVDQYITPEGKFDIVLSAIQDVDENDKPIKKFVTNFDGKYPGKTPYGMFEKVHIKNDMGYVLEQIDKY